MRILFISSIFPKNDSSSNLYTDLAEELVRNGHTVDVVVSEERKNTGCTTLNQERNGMDVLRVKSGNLYNVNFIEKTLTFMTVSHDLIKGIKNHLINREYDLILTSAPPVTFHKAVRWAMKHYSCPSYLMMKDIFPQNGLDIGLYTKYNPIYWYFKRQEKLLYKTCSMIGCMSNGNIQYMHKNNHVSLDKLELFPNTVKINDKLKLTVNQKQKIRYTYGFQDNDIIAVFGGNFGKPQGLDFLVKIIDEYKNNSHLKFLLIGTGTEQKRIFKEIEDCNLKNAVCLDYIPREDYEALLSACDIGLISLDSRFTIPNFPSKTLSYFECSIPIMAAIDKHTDYGDMLEEAEAGFYSVHGDLENFKKQFNKLLDDDKLRIKMGKNGRKYFEKNYRVENSVKILEDYERKIQNGKERH